ncbi:transcriptional regulator [Corynebacterium yudongzhengii]|uniref:Transcriptional regulator n=1 Tax=Corynebacterium yudongzhengii TaxID=2080740 RepID=A0A2U1T8D3_9CORY|nr:metalloregulator ArsR/SmtB family transcription factor [Corynebacterium yudongzhengii]AWB81864.1 transcriptional regulator [Corynebacterium yudongzhengii]PWC02256.1 transcriptional regulator [Corynebacterium yudongzhengii]
MKDPAPRRRSRPSEGDTREQVLATLLKLGPVTANDLGSRLGLSAAGVRRHLDILVEEGTAETVDRRPSGRGRPAKHFRLTDSGRAQFGHDYDTLANSALDALREAGGPEAVRRFARQHVEKVVEGIAPAADESEEALEETARQLAEALNEHGYAVTVGRAGRSIQLCKHHCPVASVAAEHSELCEAEQEVIAARLGHHVQPLASITDGHGICTTNIPLTPTNYSERSTS